MQRENNLKTLTQVCNRLKINSHDVAYIPIRIYTISNSGRVTYLYCDSCYYSWQFIIKKEDLFNFNSLTSIKYRCSKCCYEMTLHHNVRLGIIDNITERPDTSIAPATGLSPELHRKHSHFNKVVYVSGKICIYCGEVL